MVFRLLCCLFLLARSAMLGAEPEPDFLVKMWQSEDGLPGNVVRSLGQTPDGLLWVATAEGLARFDGLEFRLISGTGGYRGRRLGFFRVMTPADGSVWVSTFQGGLLKVSGDRMERCLEDQDEPNPPLVTHLIEYHGRIHFLRGETIYRLGKKAPEAVPRPDTALEAAIESEVTAQVRRGRSTAAPSLGRLACDDGSAWEIIDRSLFFHPADPRTPARVVEALERQVLVNDMLEDHEGNLWLASPVDGLVRVRQDRVMRLGRDTPLDDLAIRSAIQAHDGTWWIAGRSRGIERMRDGKVQHLELVEGGYDRPVSCLFEDRDEALWVASTDGSVFRWNGEGFDLPLRGNPSLSKVNAIAQTPDGLLWFAGGQGIASWDGTVATPYPVGLDDLPTECSTLAIGSDGEVFAGTIDGRVLRRVGARFKVDEVTPAATGRRISAIYPASSDELWVSTIGAGLFLKMGQKWHHFGADEGLPDDRLTALTVDGADTFWFGSLAGILRVSRPSLLRALDEPDRWAPWLTLDRSDGMATRECVGGSQPGSFRDQAGSIWFPTSNGLVGVSPGSLIVESTPPPVHFRSLEIDGQPVPIGQDIVQGGPGRVRLKFAFTGICLSSPEKVSYRVRLAGLDDTFQAVGNRGEMTYESVPPGRYRFDVIAINSDGVASPLPATISLRVRPFFWQTIWFGVLVGLVLAGIALLGGIDVTRRRLRRSLESLRLRGVLEKERSRISRDLHDDLGASLTELSILSALAAEKPDSKDLGQSLDTLSAKAREVVTALDEIVWATTPHEDSLRSLIEYLAAFAREFLGSARIPLHTEVERQVPDLVIGPRRRHNVFMATREALNNAVKYSRASGISLRISIEAETLLIEVRDDGVGFNPALTRTGNGLTNLRERLKDSGGDCRHESSPAKGTTVTITLPLPPA
ncbi:sensor histidine kinase [Haloferula sargassicola]|uniref:Oxygen sensor histidine kinase NreB n=1 Tax=Haloferula sargassicola TaxID=490096 RepID=A0ABP9ULX9_9BACT